MIRVVMNMNIYIMCRLHYVLNVTAMYLLLVVLIAYCLFHR